MIGQFMPVNAGITGPLVVTKKSDLTRTTYTPGVGYVFNNIGLGQQKTLICCINRYTGPFSATVDIITDLTVGGVSAPRLRNETINFDILTNKRGALAWFLADTMGGGNADIIQSGPEGTRSVIFVYGLEFYDRMLGNGGQAEGSQSTGDRAEVDIAGALPRSILFACATRGSAAGAGSPVVTGFTPDTSAFAMGDANALAWIGQNTAPANPQNIRIVSDNAAQHTVSGVILIGG